jgi:ABC-type amino acid transport substrate-binding protein
VKRTACWIIVSVLFAVASLFLPGCERSSPPVSKASGQAAAQIDSTYDSAINTKVIRAGYLVYPPAVALEKGASKPSGMFVDILERSAALMSMRVEWVEETSFATMIDALNNKRFDVLCGPIYANASRGRAVDFTTPIYYSPLAVYVRSDDGRLLQKPLSNLNDPQFKIAVVEGELTLNVAQQFFPRATLWRNAEGSASEMSLNDVVGKKADAVFAEPYIVAEFNAKNPGALRCMNPAEPLKVFPTVMLVRKSSPQFKSMIDSAFTELLNNGEVDALLRQYFPDSTHYLPVSHPFRPSNSNTTADGSSK